MNKKLKKFSDNPPSEKFLAVFGGYGTSRSVDCTCGRTYFVGDSPDYEFGELDELKKLQKEKPEEYIESEYGSITYGHIDNKVIIHECICNAGRPYEDFILNHASQIGEFLLAHAVELEMLASVARKNADNASHV